MVIVYFLTLSGIVQTSPVAACSSCGAVLGSACTTTGVVLSRIWAASDDGKIVVGSLYTVGGSLQQSNYYMSQIILMMFCGFYGNHAQLLSTSANTVHTITDLQNVVSRETTSWMNKFKRQTWLNVSWISSNCHRNTTFSLWKIW